MGHSGRVVQHVDGGALSRRKVIIVLVIGEQQVLDVLLQVLAVELDPLRVDLLAPVVVDGVPGEPRRVLAVQVGLVVVVELFGIVALVIVIVMRVVVLDSGR